MKAGAGAGLLQQGAVLGVERIQPAPLAEEPEARGAAGQRECGSETVWNCYWNEIAFVYPRGAEAGWLPL